MEAQIDALLRRESDLPRHDERRGIGERHVSAVDDVEAHFSRSAAVTNAAATSPILRPWSIAVFRNSA